MNNKIMSNLNFYEKISECVGLWLAEGDNKSKYELTFTNNCFELIQLFHETLSFLFKSYSPRIRIYVYSFNGEEIQVPITGVDLKYYVHKKATKPYYIWRLASVIIMKEWKTIIEELKQNPDCYAGILSGFFAGEGSVRESTNKSRCLKISQAKRILEIENMLNFFKISYKFSTHHREGYIISGRENLIKADQIGLVSLHPEKQLKFRKLLNSYVQTHYSRGYLKNQIIFLFDKNKYFTTNELANLYSKSSARIRDILMVLKKEGKITNFRIKSIDYWIKTPGFIIICNKKSKYLNILKNKEQTSNNLSQLTDDKCHSISKHLKVMEKRGLVMRYNSLWYYQNINEKVIVIWY